MERHTHPHTHQPPSAPAPQRVIYKLTRVVLEPMQEGVTYKLTRVVMEPMHDASLRMLLYDMELAKPET